MSRVENSSGAHLEEGCTDIGSQGPCQQGLTSTRGAIEEDTLRWLDTHTDEQLGVGEWKLNHLSQFTDLIVET